jgi:polysaccharide export outer membrane protein
MPHALSAARALPWLSLVGVLSGCIGNRVIYPLKPSPDELAEFSAAGPPDVPLTVEGVGTMQLGGPYRIVSGDLLSIELPAEVQEVEDQGALTVQLRCRVTSAGTIQLPMVGDLPVAGRTVQEIEQDLATEYQKDDRLKARPNVVVSVEEYRTVPVAVIGAVSAPGIHDLRSDRLSVLGALMAAGGIEPQRGAARIRVVRPDGAGGTSVEFLDVRLKDIPLADVPLLGRETIVVEPPSERQFAVIGLVRKSGVFPYPEPRRYTLMQALATAGGVDDMAAPRYATVYRQRADGQIIGATFKIDGTSLLDASSVVIKDGDVIAVEHTQGSWTRQFLSQVLGFRASFTVSGASSATL